MKIYRFMSIAEFQNYLKGQKIEGTFVKGKACFLEGKILAREKEDSVKALTDLTSLNFKSTDFEGQMKELSELISPVFMDGNFDGQLKKIEYLSLADFMSKVREEATAEVLVEFETTDAFEQECEKVIMAYRKYLLQEIQSNGYSNETLRCTSYTIDLINRFKNGVGVDTIQPYTFESVEQALTDLENAIKGKGTLPIAEDLKQSAKTIATNSEQKKRDIQDTQSEVKTFFRETENPEQAIETSKKSLDD